MDAQSPTTVRRKAKLSGKTLPRRRLLAGQWLPPQIDARCTYGEMAIWSAIASETAASGFCDLDRPVIAERAGAATVSVERAIRKATALELIKVKGRRIDIISPAWLDWIDAGQRRVARERRGSTERRHPAAGAEVSREPEA